MILRHLSSFSIIFLLGKMVFAQNLIPNPGFEEHKNCLGFNTQLKEWIMPVGDYYHYLSDCPVGKAQYNGEEKNKPHEGKCLAGICLHSNEAGEYMLAKLNAPLQKDLEYIFSGYILLASEKQDKYINFTHIEVALTDKAYTVTNPSHIFFDPQISIPLSFEKKEKEWIYISGKFIASGNEAYFLIGNFLPVTNITDELNEYMLLAPDEREKYLKKHKKLEEAMSSASSKLTGSSKPYSIRCYLDDLCLMPASDTAKGLCNYPLKKIATPPLKIEVFKPIVIENIFFEIAKSGLLPASFKALDSLANWLKANAPVEIQITGHTDNKGTEKENNTLSTERAAAVKNYLVAKGANNKIESTGLGSTKPIAGNETEEGRSKNRRVEFVITKK